MGQCDVREATPGAEATYERQLQGSERQQNGSNIKRYVMGRTAIP